MTLGSDPRQKTGYQLRRSVVLAVRDAARDGAAESQNAYGEAARDPLFMEEMKATDAAWDAVTGDGLHANG